MFRFSYLIAALTFCLSGCATSTPYAPMDGRYGYSEQQIEADRFRVLFHGNNSTSRETVEAFLLYRAAELTLENGFDYFVVVEQDTDVSRSYTSMGREPLLYGHYLVGHRRFPYYAYGYRWAYDVDVREQRQFEAHAFIRLFRGEKPEGDIRAFDAREVILHLKSRVLQSLAGN
ncbi:MAG: hypothetical protein GC196_13250 [Hyphomonas sp.]|nr:hypothetical protein [Hyphomonas sp.]